MRSAPVAGKNFADGTALIDDGVDDENRIDQGRDPFTFFIHCVAVQQPCADTRAPPAEFEIHRQHVCGLDSSRGSKAGTNRFAPAGESGEIMKANRAGQDHLGKISCSGPPATAGGSD